MLHNYEVGSAGVCCYIVEKNSMGRFHAFNASDSLFSASQLVIHNKAISTLRDGRMFSKSVSL